MPETHLLETGASTQSYYQSINRAYHKLYNKPLMLHYPLFKEPGESLEIRQINLTNHCISCIDSLENKHVLEVGCGNGIQSIYIYERFNPVQFTGVDINPFNIRLADTINGSHQNLRFLVDDAQQLKNIPDNSIDVFLCIESAFHYPDKLKFIEEMRRVLKPSGIFLIADLLASSQKKRYFLERWKKKMNYHHWTKEQYLQAFKEKGLQLMHNENITKPVIKGYRGYNNWVSRNKFNYYTGYLWYKIFVIIQVKVNIYLLKKRRHYYIFTGKIE